MKSVTAKTAGDLQKVCPSFEKRFIPCTLHAIVPLKQAQSMFGYSAKVLDIVSEIVSGRQLVEDNNAWLESSKSLVHFFLFPQLKLPDRSAQFSLCKHHEGRFFFSLQDGWLVLDVRPPTEIAKVH